MVIKAKMGNKTTTAPINIQGGIAVQNRFFLLFDAMLFFKQKGCHTGNQTQIQVKAAKTVSQIRSGQKRLGLNGYFLPMFGLF
jgi:hypothetical protein